MSTSNISASTTSSIPQSNIIQATYIIFVIVVALLGNLSVVTVIFRKNLLENVTNYFILNLAISDFLNAALKMSTSVAGLFDRDWYPTKDVCYFTTPCGVLFGAASVLSLTSVAVTRCLVITWPFTYATKVTSSLACSILAGVWCASVALSFPPITWRPASIICRSGAVSNADYNSELIYLIALWLFVIVLPSAVMFTSYFCIYRVTSVQLRRITTTHTAEHGRRQAMCRKRELRAAMLLAFIGGIFILCWFPFFVMLTLHKFAEQKTNPMYLKVFLCWMYTNSAFNPILLVLFNNNIKTAMQRMLCLGRRVQPGAGPVGLRATTIAGNE